LDNNIYLLPLFWALIGVIWDCIGFLANNELAVTLGLFIIAFAIGVAIGFWIFSGISEPIEAKYPI
jgi:hypothetical protein